MRLCLNPEAHLQGNLGAQPTKLENAATQGTDSQKNCVCLCYGSDSYHQKDQPRFTSDTKSDQAKFGQSDQASNDRSDHSDGAAYHTPKDSEEHNTGSKINNYYVNKWGETTSSTENDLTFPTLKPTSFPTKSPTVEEIEATGAPTISPTKEPTKAPSASPTASPTWNQAFRAQALEREQTFSSGVASDEIGRASCRERV